MKLFSMALSNKWCCKNSQEGREKEEIKKKTDEHSTLSKIIISFLTNRIKELSYQKKP